MSFVRAQAATNTPIVDPLAEHLAMCGRRTTGDSKHDLPLFLALPGVFSADVAGNAGFARALGNAYDLIARRGPLDAITMVDE